jgi:F0F1-type ATP synthase membrane subunit c/vacuolar-type H+-ATPase subunit K
MEPQRKLLQAVRIALLVSIALYVFIGERMGRSTTSAPDRNVYFAITLVAITTVGMVFAVWRLFVLRSEAILADHPEDTTALKRWRTGYIFTYTLCETVALFGFVLRFMGFTLSEVAPFYVVGFALMLLFSPRRLRII